MKIVYIADKVKKQQSKRLSKKELFHRMAVEGLAAQYLKDEKRADKLFAKEIEELDQLKKRLQELNRPCHL